MTKSTLKHTINLQEDLTRAEEQTKRYASQLTLINHVASQIAASLQLGKVLNSAAELLHQTFNYHHVALFLLEEDVACLKAVAGAYSTYFPPDHTQKLTEGIIGWVARNGRKMIANDVATNPHYISLIPDHTETHSELCLPIRIADKIIGILDIQSPQLNAFGGSDVIATEILADQIAVAVENARLYEAISHELQERNTMQEALRQSEIRYRIVSELTSDFAYAICIHPDYTLTVDWITDAFTRITGLDREEMTINNGTTIVYQDDFPILRQMLQTTFAGQTTTNEIRIMTRQGEIRWLRCYNRPIWNDNEGRVTYLYGAAQDITARKHMEQAVQHAQKLESLGIMASGIAHDFNNLLTAIMAENSLALLKIPANSPATQNITNALAGAERAADLTRQMLAYAGKGQFQLTGVDLNHLIRELLSLLIITLPKNITLETSLAPTPVIIEADTGQIQQVIMNLVINAAEAYESQPGIVKVITNSFEIQEGENTWDATGQQIPQGRYIRLFVTDMGKGMDKSTLERIFDPFFTTKFTGRGLGLASVQGIVQGHKGVLRVFSDLGKGTTFEVLFPVFNSFPIEQPKDQLRQTPPPVCTILLAEDEKPIRKVMMEVLEMAGYQVLLAENGKEAVHLFQQHINQVQLILLDKTMPVMDGIEATIAIRDLRKDIPIILLSGYEEEKIAQLQTDGGEIAFIKKPFRLEQLINKVQTMINRPLYLT